MYLKKRKHYRKKKYFIHKKEERNIHCSPCKILDRKYCNRSFPHCNPTAVEKCLRSILTWQAVPSCKYHCLIWRVWSGAQTQAQEMAGFDSIRRQFFTSSNYPFLTTIWNSHRGPAFTYGTAKVGSS